jgi:prevent-host-death family protein
MIVNSTELQNNFGKYLMLVAQEDIIITRNGIEIARLSGIRDTGAEGSQASALVWEKAQDYRATPQKVSYEKFLELSRNSEERYEYIDGEIYLLASPKTAHQRALTELFGFFFNWFQGQECTPMVAPFDITLRRNQEDINVVQPDIMVICDLEEKLDENDYYQGVPALVVEILSEGTRSKDLITKLDLYMSCEVKEYWIVNPLNKEVTVYLFENQNISNSVTFKKSEMIQSYIFEGLCVELDRILK